MKILLVLVAMVCVTSAYAQQHGPHKHGVASLEVFAEGNVLELRLESPLDNLVGFESAPGNPKQHEAIRGMVEHFERPGRLFAPTAAAGCLASAVKLESEVLDPDLLKLASPAPRAEVQVGRTGQESPHSPHSARAGHAGDSRSEAKHADLDAHITFTCTAPETLNSVHVLLFQAFPGLHRVDAQVVTTKGQRAARLSAESSLLRW